jgi:hypothetical protein
MIGVMRTWHRPPSRDALPPPRSALRRTGRRAGHEPGKPAAALAIIATIFATALVIKLLPPATRSALLQVTTRDLSSRAVAIWSESPAAIPQSMWSFQAPAAVKPRPVTIAVEPPPVETAVAVPFMFDPDPGKAPALDATALLLVALPIEVEPVSAGIEPEPGTSPLVMPFARTGSALRLAFVKTGSAIKAAASGTAGVFVSNP